MQNAEFFTLGGEIESRLAYTQKSEGQNLPGRPVFAKATTRQAIFISTKNKHLGTREFEMATVIDRRYRNL